PVAAGATVDLAVGSSAGGTNVQEAGVDEADIAKTDGRHVYAVQGRRLTVHEITGVTPRLLTRIVLPRHVHGAELLLADDRLVVLGGTSGAPPGPAARSAVIDSIWPAGGGSTLVRTYHVADPASPVLLSDEVVEGSVLGARLHDDGDDAAVRLSFRHHGPALDFVQPNRRRTRADALRHNRDLVRRSVIEDWLPHVRPANGGAGAPLVDCDDVALVDDRAAAGTVSLLAWDVPAGPTARTATAIATESDLLYASTDRVYLATRDWQRPRTGVHAFALEAGAGEDGPTTRYLGSGTVPGRVADRWSFDAHDGTLRVASALGRSWNPRENAVTVLAEGEGELVEVGQVAGMGRREQIHAVRWFDDLAVLVTFRQVDPLYTVDLTDPTSPRLLGELKIPGFSAYLHPIGDGRVLGLGQDATARGRTRGAQASLFDLGDLADPRRTASAGLGRHTNWGAEWEPRTFTWLPQRRLGIAVADFWQRGRRGPRLVAVEPDGDRLTATVLPHPVGRWGSDSVRTLPLADERVAVVSRRGVEVVDLDRELSPGGG
ncbi:beta-propeller domain-containing protein, partial [Nocardioides massiliensis]